MQFLIIATNKLYYHSINNTILYSIHLIILTTSSTTDITTNVCLLYLFPYVLMNLGCKLTEDGDNAKTYRS
jgi:hypothetical protein